MALEKYRARRNFGATPEPRGTVSRRKAPNLAFIVQKHAASRLHYDFRLELNGVFLSWAIPKGPSLDPADKRLAVQTEDHPMEYGSFEGVIPERQYGAGTVMLWDRGIWIPKGDAAAGYAEGHLKFELQGEKLAGGWVLVRSHSSSYGGKHGERAWLLIKERDAFARSGGRSIVDTAPDSVSTQRSLQEIAKARSRVWQSNRSAAANVKAGAVVAPDVKRASASRATSLPKGARRAPMPALISPALATLVAQIPEGASWLHEIKYDGYRMVCRIARGKAHLFSRNGKDWTAIFPALARDLERLPVRTAWLDGEVVVVDAQGRTSFQALQNAMSDRAGKALTFFAFDLMYLDGVDLRGAGLAQRKALLRGVVGDGVGGVRVGPEVEGSGSDFFRQACLLRLEGAVCKRADSAYREGTRSRDWLKVKCVRRQEMVIGGYTDPQGARSGFGALLLGVYERGRLRYSGKVGTGFDDRSLDQIARLLRQLTRASPPFVDPPRGFEAKGAHWVSPDLVAEVAFTEWSDDGALRHPSFKGLRTDKKATEVVREEPGNVEKERAAA